MSSDKLYSIIIKKGDTLRIISNKLYDSGLIKNREVFEFFAMLSNYEKFIKSGYYEISNVTSIKEILLKLNLGEVVRYRITITECMTNITIFNILNSTKSFSGKLLLTDLPVEGYLAPNTYFYEQGDDRKDILNKLENIQQKKLKEIWDKRSSNIDLNSSYELLILASIIEKETGIYDELSLISSVLHNRLKKNMRLQADPTVIYGLTGGKKLGRPLTKKDLKKPSLYNTYLINGLPISPICNPSEAALIAAANPEKTNFFYYVSNGVGGHFFSTNLEEHNKNVKLFRSIKRNSY